MRQRLPVQAGGAGADLGWDLRACPAVVDRALLGD